MHSNVGKSGKNVKNWNWIFNITCQPHAKVLEIGNWRKLYTTGIVLRKNIKITFGTVKIGFQEKCGLNNNKVSKRRWKYRTIRQD